ncbi:ABC transporter substrate-binding protein [Candidatus Poribacteria bacterium]|nr:ABC transporter substrate-binding protein [Candidatus Poribacteria bacterium]
MYYKTIKNYFYIVIICFCILQILGCEKITQVIEPNEIENSNIPIGLVLPLSGRLSNTFGVPINQALQLANDEINESTKYNFGFNFIVEDNYSTVVGATNAYNKFIEDGISVIIGPATSTATKETFPIADKNGVIAISPTSAARGLSSLSDYAFRIALTSDVLVPNGVEEILSRFTFSRVATLYDRNDEFSKDSEQALLEILDLKEIEVVVSETFISGDVDFSQQLANIEMEKPDVVFVSSLPPEKVRIMKQSREFGITARLVIRTLTDADVEAAGDAAEGTITFTGWGTAVDNPLNKVFVKNFINKYGTVPKNYAARAYVTLYVLAEAISNSTAIDTMSIRDALGKISELDTIVGKFSFNQDGDAVYEPQVLIVKDGKLEILDTE